jgi:hypothetical protein
MDNEKRTLASADLVKDESNVHTAYFTIEYEAEYQILPRKRLNGLVSVSFICFRQDAGLNFRTPQLKELTNTD